MNSSAGILHPPLPLKSYISSISSGQGSRSNGAHGYLLVLDQTRILLDCGWDESFGEASVSLLAAIADTIDVILISHATVSHLGALPYLVGALGCRAKIYATFPVKRLGQLIMLDALNAHKLRNSDFDAFTADHVEETFNACESEDGGRMCIEPLR